MILQPVLLSIPPDDSLSPRERVQQQREYARRALAECAGICGAPAEGWQQDANRVPLKNGKYFWSISHKPTYAAAVISEHPVGIDIENTKPRRNADLWDRIATTEEWERVGERNWLTFYMLWTAKEATLKANGLGIGALERCRVIDRLNGQHTKLLLDNKEWQVEHYFLKEHVAAVTLSGGQIKWKVVE